MAHSFIQFIGTPSRSDAFARSWSLPDRGWARAKRSSSAEVSRARRSRSTVRVVGVIAAEDRVSRATASRTDPVDAMRSKRDQRRSRRDAASQCDVSAGEAADRARGHVRVAESTTRKLVQPLVLQ